MRTKPVVFALFGALTAVGCTSILGDFSLPPGATGDGGGDDAQLSDGAPDDGGAGTDSPASGDASGDTGAHECEAGARDCFGNKPRSCVSGQWVESICTEDNPICSGAGTCATPPSCGALLGNCGQAATAHTCCNAPVVEGATFNRFNKPAFAATIGSVRLNRYDVTVARFRAFVAAGKGITTAAPPNGAGAHPKVANSGWQSAYDSQLLGSTQSLTDAVTACAGFSNSTYQPAGVISSNNKPMNCVTYFEALAFCIWDRGRLPSVAELELATRGGTEQRLGPWGTAAQDNTRAVYCSSKASGTGVCNSPDTAGGMVDVGSLNAGAGRWGHLDLFGLVRQYTLDIYTPMPALCIDCVQTSTASATTHGALGGSWSDNIDSWTNIYNVSPTTSTNPRTPAGGFRCAYDL